MKKIIPIIIGVVVIVGVGAFFAGYKVGQSSSSSVRKTNGFPTDFAGGMQSGLRSGNATGAKNVGGIISGEILSKDDSSITIKLNDGGSKIVFYSEITEISKTVDGMTSDLEVGKIVMVSGTTNQDGSITAKTVQLRPVINVPNTSPRP